MKRLRILTKPTTIADLAEIDVDAFDEKWLLREEKILAKRARLFRHQLAS